MAKCIAEGARSVTGVNVLLKKLGEPFSLRILDDANAIILGAPAHYAHVTPEMRNFLASSEMRMKQEDLNSKEKLALLSGDTDGMVA